MTCFCSRHRAMERVKENVLQYLIGYNVTLVYRADPQTRNIPFYHKPHHVVVQASLYRHRDQAAAGSFQTPASSVRSLPSGSYLFLTATSFSRVSAPNVSNPFWAGIPPPSFM